MAGQKLRAVHLQLLVTMSDAAPIATYGSGQTAVHRIRNLGLYPQAHIMMSGFLADHHDELVARCKAKVALRPRRVATPAQLSNGVPLFIAQLQRTLEAEEGAGGAAESLKISGESGGSVLTESEMGVSATAHGRELLELGFSVDQVVHDYGDLCQAITDLAFERDAPFSIDEFRTLNRCLDNAIASAVSAFSAQRDALLGRRQDEDVNERVGVFVYELRNSLAAASYAVAALEQGNLPMSGATGAVLKRSLAALKTLMDRLPDPAGTHAEAIDPGQGSGNGDGRRDLHRS